MMRGKVPIDIDVRRCIRRWQNGWYQEKQYRELQTCMLRVKKILDELSVNDMAYRFPIYRGLHFEDMSVLNNLRSSGKLSVDCRDYESWTFDPEVALEFASANQTEYNVWLVISRPKPKKGTVVADVRAAMPYSGFSSECEIICKSQCVNCRLSDIECIWTRKKFLWDVADMLKGNGYGTNSDINAAQRSRNPIFVLNHKKRKYKMSSTRAPIEWNRKPNPKACR